MRKFFFEVTRSVALGIADALKEAFATKSDPPPRDPQIDRMLELLYEVGSFKNIERTWKQFYGLPVANVLEHSARAQWVALQLVKLEGRGDTGKILHMILMHDLAEARTLDATILHKRYIRQDEHRAVQEAIEGTGLEWMHDILKEYLERKTIEAQIAKDADILEFELELNEARQRGSYFPDAIHADRIKARARLYTESARRMFDAIPGSSPDAWHLHIRNAAE